MVMIPQLNDPTLDAMLRMIETQPNEDRGYLGASQIGDECARKIWYKFNKFPERASEYKAIGTMAAESGYYAEDITAKRLSAVRGIELSVLNSLGGQHGWSAFDGKFKGHVDGLIKGILQAPVAQHIWEHKDKDHKKFSDFQNKKASFGEKNTLKNWNIQYYGQAQINMHYMKIDRHYLTISYAGARKYDSCRTNYDPVYAEQLNDKAYKIINTSAPPMRVNDKPDFYLCKFCPFKDECHGR